MPRLAARWCPWVVAALVPAQDPAPPPSPPPSPPPAELLRLECDGPAAWRTKFAPTNFGVLLASEVGGNLWRPRLQQFEAMLGRWFYGGKVDAEPTPARQRWLDFAGRIELVVWMPAVGGDRAAARPRVAVRLHGDGRSDVDAMATDLRAVLVAAADLARHQDPIDDPVWQALPRLGEKVSPARRTGNSVLLCLGDAADLAATEGLAAALPAPAPDAGCLRLVLNPRAAEFAMAEADPALARSWHALGLGALHEVEFRVGTAGPHVLFEAGARFRGDERGLFAALFPAAAQLPPLLHLLPVDGTPWKLGHFDWATFQRASHAGEDAYRGDRAGTSRAAEEREHGQDLEADLFAHLHTDYLLLGMPGSHPTKGIDLTACWILRTRDDAKLAAGVARMLARWPKLFETTRTTAHDGVKITSYPDFPEPLVIAIGRGLCIGAIGDGASERVIAVLDRAKGKPLEVPSADWLSTMRHAPPGANGIGEADLHELLQRQVPLLLTIAAFLPMELAAFLPHDDIDAIAEQVAPLLDRFALRRLRTITGYHDGRWTFRAVW